MGGPTDRRGETRASRTAVLLAIALLAAGAPAAGLGLPVSPTGGGGDDPEAEHELAVALCESGDARTMLAGVAAFKGVLPPAGAVPPVRTDVPFPVAVANLYAALGLTVTDRELLRLEARLRAVDPAVALPMAVLTQAMADAARLNARALAALSADDIAAIVAAAEADSAALLRGEEPPAWPSRARAASERVDTRLQVAAALLLLDAVDVATPLIEAAVALERWLRDGHVADPVGLIRIGGTGDDVETQERALVVDPRGNDRCFARVGGATQPGWGVSPVALFLDLEGDDTYDVGMFLQAAWGASMVGIAVHVDAAGDDSYRGQSGLTLGAADNGVAVFVDGGGNDRYDVPGSALGYGNTRGIGIAMETGGNDSVVTGSGSLGVGINGRLGVGFFCDWDGLDSYRATQSSALGYARYEDATGWFVDLGGHPDVYAVQPINSWEPHPAGNDRLWTVGALGGTGHGVDR